MFENVDCIHLVDWNAISHTRRGTTVKGQLSTIMSIPNYNNDALQGYARNIGGSAGEGTHGGTAVNRPSGMPTRNDADFIVSTPSGLKDAVKNDNSIVYIDDSITLHSSETTTLGSNVQIVGGFCDPNIPGRGPVIEQRKLENPDPDLDPQNPVFKRRGGEPPTLWGVSMRGPKLDYFDPSNVHAKSNSGIWCVTSASTTFKAVGCEFWGWTFAGIVLGMVNPKIATDAKIIRCSFHHNRMEGLGYGIEQFQGHLWCDRSFFNRCRHGIASYGTKEASWELTESVIGPDGWAGHAMDMHDYGGNNHGGHHFHVRDCTFKMTEGIPGTTGTPDNSQEAIAQRGVSVAGDEIWGCDFWHSSRPEEPGHHGEAFRQEDAQERDSWENFHSYDNAYDGPNGGYGAPRATDTSQSASFTASQTSLAIIDDFENGDRSGWTVPGSAGSDTVVSDGHDGSSFCWRHSNVRKGYLAGGDAVDRGPQPGDTFEFWFRIMSTSGEVVNRFVFSASGSNLFSNGTDNPNSYRVEFERDTANNELSIEKISGGLQTELATDETFEPAIGQRYRCQIGWNDRNNEITVQVFHPDGTAASSKISITDDSAAAGSAFQQPGIYIMNGGNNICEWDEIKIIK